MHVGYALVNFRFRTCGFTRVAPDRFALWTRCLFKESFCCCRWADFLPANENPVCNYRKWLSVNYWKWLSVFTQLLPWNFGQRAARCLGIGKPLVGGIPSDTCSAYRLCGVATKPPLQTFVFDRQKKITGLSKTDKTIVTLMTQLWD